MTLAGSSSACLCGARRLEHLKPKKPAEDHPAGFFKFNNLEKPLHNPFALRAFAGELAGAAHRFGLLAGLLLRRLLEVLTRLHFTEQAFALHFLLQGAQGLFNVVITHDDLYDGTSPCGRAVRRCQGWN